MPGVTSDRPRIFFDISELLVYARLHHRISGIQRFSLAVISHILRTYPQDGFAIVAYHPTFKRPVQIDGDWLTKGFEFKNDEFATSLALNLLRPHEYLRKFKHRPIKYAARWLQIVGAVLSGNARFFRKRQLRPFWASSRRLKMENYATLLTSVSFKPGDQLVVLGATGGGPDYRDYLTRAVGDGAALSLFVHDVIPLVEPQYMTDDVPPQFRHWMTFMSGLATRFYVNSRSTGADLKTVLATLAPGLDPTISLVPLAHEFQGEAGKESGDAGGERERIRAAVLAATRRPYVLVVGTIETRKNGWGILRVWQQVIETFGLSAPRIVFAGRRGWMIEDFEALRHATGNLGGHVQFVEMASDAEIEHLYRNCLFTLYPSFYEGWGLPIGESLWFGKTCITSTISSMPEVAQDMCLLVDPSDLSGMYQYVERLISDEPFRAEMEQKIDRAQLRRWADVGDDLRNAVIQTQNAPDAATAAIASAPLRMAGRSVGAI